MHWAGYKEADSSGGVQGGGHAWWGMRSWMHRAGDKQMRPAVDKEVLTARTNS